MSRIQEAHAQSKILLDFEQPRFFVSYSISGILKRNLFQVSPKRIIWRWDIFDILDTDGHFSSEDQTLCWTRPSVRKKKKEKKKKRIQGSRKRL